MRPRTAEQGFGAAWSRGPACGDAFAEPIVGALLRSRIRAHLPGQIPIHGAPLPPCGAPRARGCAPDPVRVAPVREGAHKAAIGIGETGRDASAPANGPSANGSQPPPDPVREAPVREGAHKAAIDISETGRNASAPANGPAANGSQPYPVAGCLRTGANAGLHTPRRICKDARFVTKYEANSRCLLCR